MKYSVRIYQYAAMGATASYGVGTLVADLQNAKNIGYADYANDVPEAFFTLAQEDPEALVVRNNENKAHVRIFRDGELVWGGWLGEADVTHRDVVFYCYGYASSLYSLSTGYNQTWENKKPISEIALPLFQQVQGYSYSPLRWCTTGTISDAKTESGGATDLTIPRYATYYKRAIFSMREIAAISASDTNQICRFWISPSGVFNFTTVASGSVNRKPEAVIAWGDDRLQGYAERRMPVEYRNQLAMVGNKPNSTDSTVATNAVSPIIVTSLPAATGYIFGQLAQVEGGDLYRRGVTGTTATWILESTGDADLKDYGLRQESIYFNYIPAMADMHRVGRLRLKRAKRADISLSLSLFANSFTSPASASALCTIGDIIPIRIQRGATNINTDMLVSGYKVIWQREAETVRLILQDTP